MRRAVVGVLVLLVSASSALAQGSFVNFESGHVRPLALSPDGNRLFAVNTPDNRLEIFDITGGGLSLAAEVPVGLEPVAVAARVNSLTSRTEVWVVNHLSDSVSIVEIDAADVTLSRVKRTLLVGDEPRDIVFGGSGHNRAFVTTARRGQNSIVAANLTTEGTERALVWVFDAESPGAALGGTPTTVLQLFGDTPRALAVNGSGTRVYAAVFHSGNQTTTINETVVRNNGGLPPPPPGSTANPPSTGLIVKFNPGAGQWRDEINRNWSASVAFNLPDRDVFIIDADANPPALVGGTNNVTGVGTVLFNMAVRPGNGKIYVSNTEARNQVRFEPFIDAARGVQGHIAESRISIINGTAATPVHLNPHINYTVIPGPPSEVEQSLAFPTDMAFSGDGATLYVAAFGSGKVGVLDAAALESGTVSEQQIQVGGGPSGLALDEGRDRLYVMNRFDHAISVVSNVSNAGMRSVASVPLRYDPSPPIARVGRRFLYDARTTSAHGDSACASCHIFGDFDSLAWDLGDPFGAVVANPNPFRVGTGNPFHPLKGPMTTQSLRGMANNGPMHWRGDRTGGTTGQDPLDEDLAFKAFNPAFVGLLGRSSQLSASEMQDFTNFILTVRYPPNPIRALDNLGTPSQNSGANIFNNNLIDGGAIQCQFCHRLPLGADGLSSIEGEPQEFKIAHLRNIYQKVGMFGVPNGVAGIPATGNLGDQVRGFGFLHDGSVATAFDFLNADVFLGINDAQRRDLEAFVLAFDTGLRPVVGQQVSATSGASGTWSDGDVIGRIDLLIARDNAGDCDLVVKGIVNGEARGLVYVSANNFQWDRAGAPLIDKTSLRTVASTAGQDLTYTCVPPGSGARIGIDRDEDGFLDRDEIDLGSDPANPASTPVVATPTQTSTPTATQTPTQTSTPSNTATRTSTSTATDTPTQTPSSTPTPTIDCAGAIVIDQAKVRVAVDLDPSGDERLTLRGDVQLGAAIDPIADGLRFRVDGQAATTLYARLVPAGAQAAPTSPGWKQSASGKRWVYKDRNGVAAPGIVRAVVIDRSATGTPNLYRFRIVGRRSDFQVRPGEDPVSVVVVFSPTQCARRSFQPSGGLPPTCELLASGAVLNCR